MSFFRLFIRILKIGKDERWLAFSFGFAALAIGLAQILEPILFGRVIDALAKESQFLSYVGLWIALSATNTLISIYLAIASDRYSHRQRLKSMELAFARTISLPYRYHSLHGSGRVVRTIQAGSDLVFHLLLSFYRENLIALASVVLLVPMAFFLAPKLASVLCVLAAVFTVANTLVIRRIQAGQIRVEAKHQHMAAQIVDVMGNVTIVRAFTRVREELVLFRQLIIDMLQTQYPVLTWWGILNVITRLSSMLAMLTIVAIGANLVQAGQATQGEIVTFVGFSTLMINRLDQLSSFINRIVHQLPTAANLFALLDQKSDEDQLQKNFVHGTPTGRVEFKNVSYCYHADSMHTQGVFDLSFTAEPGETIAIVGPTGAGKSTCLALLQRLYVPDAGSITIDGQDIHDLAVDKLCAAIATVFQEPGLFNRSIFDNIQIGRPNATRAEVEEAARLAYAHDFIVARPAGYDFVVGERGLALSGGERQRIAIARAILKDAPILILDEATSALDNETEKLVQHAMEHLRRGKTTFVIAHRLSTILTADHILVMNDGRIVQAGTYAELSQASGLFARLIKAGQIAEAPPEALLPTPVSPKLSAQH